MRKKTKTLNQYTIFYYEQKKKQQEWRKNATRIDGFILQTWSNGGENGNVLAMLFQNDTYELHLLFLIIQKPQIIKTQNKNYCFFFFIFWGKIKFQSKLVSVTVFFFFRRENSAERRYFPRNCFFACGRLTKFKETCLNERISPKLFFRPRQDN